MLQNLEFWFSPRERIGVTATQGKFGAQSCGLVELRNRASSQSILSCSFSNNLCLLAHIHSFRSHASVVLLYPYTDDMHTVLPCQQTYHQQVGNKHPDRCWLTVVSWWWPRSWLPLLYLLTTVCLLECCQSQSLAPVSFCMVQAN
jgi:hypothetical protein